MGCERKRETGDDRHEPRDRCCAVTEVRVNVAYIAGFKQQVCNPYGLEKFLQVQLARPREKTPACSNCLRECERFGVDEAAWFLFEHGANCRPKVVQM